MRTLLVVLVAAFLLTSVAGCKTECERNAEKICERVTTDSEEECELAFLIRCTQNGGR